LKFEGSQQMANRTNLWALIVGVGLWLTIAAAPAAALAGGQCCQPPAPPPSCNCSPPPCCTPPTPPPPPMSPCCAPAVVVPSVNVFVAPAVNVNVNASATAISAAGAQAQTFVGGGGGGGSMIGPGPVSMVNLGVGGSEREAYEAMRTRIEKVVIQAFCFDDKEVPHPASQVAPDRDIDEAYDGEIYRCIAGAHMQVTIAAWKEHISFEGGQTLACLKGEALYHVPGKGGGRLECRPQKPARDCNERSLLRRFGAGIKILTLVITEKYTAYREVSHESANVVMSLDGGVGGVVY
jgi:hypothetical protein